MLKSNAITPLYQQLMEKIKDEIASGRYRPGDKLPSEVDMARQNSVSVITARKAMDELVNAEIVEKKQGKGTFVSLRKYDRDYTRIMGFGESCTKIGLTPGSELLERKLILPSEKMAKSLEIGLGESIVYISRLRTVDGEPMVIEVNQFSIEYAFLLNSELDGSLFKLLREKKGVAIAKSKKSIEICRANQLEAKLLRLKKGHPLLLVNSVAYDENSNPIYVGKQIINGERFTLNI